MLNKYAKESFFGTKMLFYCDRERKNEFLKERCHFCQKKSMFHFKIAQQLQHSSEMCLSLGLEWDAVMYHGSGLSQRSLSPEVSFLVRSMGFYNCWTVPEIKLFFLSFLKQNPKRICKSKSSLHYPLLFTRQSGHNSALDFTSRNEITLNRNWCSGGLHSDCSFFYYWKRC